MGLTDKTRAIRATKTWKKKRKEKRTTSLSNRADSLHRPAETIMLWSQPYLLFTKAPSCTTRRDDVPDSWFISSPVSSPLPYFLLQYHLVYHLVSLSYFLPLSLPLSLSLLTSSPLSLPCSSRLLATFNRQSDSNWPWFWFSMLACHGPPWKSYCSHTCGPHAFILMKDTACYTEEKTLTTKAAASLFSAALSRGKMFRPWLSFSLTFF